MPSLAGVAAFESDAVSPLATGGAAVVDSAGEPVASSLMGVSSWLSAAPMHFCKEEGETVRVMIIEGLPLADFRRPSGVAFEGAIALCGLQCPYWSATMGVEPSL